MNRSLRALQDAISEATAALARRLDMSTTDATAIEHIAGSASAIGPAELASRLSVTRSSATEVVDRLVGAGHIERVRDETDRRRFHLVPTGSAVARVRNELDPLARSLAAVTAGFTPEEQRTIEAFLSSATAAYRAYASEPEPKR